MIWSPLHILLAMVYLVGILMVGFWTGRTKRDSNQFLNATASLPLWVCITACIAANCGSLDVIAVMALGAQYGILAGHFYWIGAIPALVVAAFWLLPAYARGRYPSVLDYIGRYYGARVRSLVALNMAVMMLLLAGVCLCAAAEVLSAFLGWSFLTGVLLTAALVLSYTWVGGLRATVYTELLHFAVVLLAVVPLFFLVLRGFGGFTRLLAAIPPSRLHAWQDLPLVAPGAVMDRLGLVVGLGVILAGSYWCTDFVQMQRALAVRRALDVPYVPLSIAAAKLVFAFLVVLPGVAAPLVLGSAHTDWNATLPEMMVHYFSPAWVTVGVMGLAASLVSTFANNVSGFSSAWVQGVYQQWIRPGASDAHYMTASRITNAVAVLASIGAAYMALSYHSLMEYIQLILSSFNAPLFALVVLAALAPRLARGGGAAGLAAGMGATIAHQLLARAGVLHYGSRMTSNFYVGILGFGLTLAGVLLAGVVRRQRGVVPAPVEGLRRAPVRFTVPTVLWACLIVGLCVWINILFR